MGYISFIGILLVLIGAGLYFYDKSKKTHYLINGFLYLSWISASLFTYYLFDLFSQDHSEDIEGINSVFGYIKYLEIQKNSINAQSLAPLGMMIAALIASASVMKNIAETKGNEVKKHAKEDSKFYLERCIGYLKEVDELIGKLQNDKFSWAQAAKILISMREISQKTYITETSHQKIFEIEYTNSRLKLFRSMINLSEDRKINSITPAFFCSVSNWKTKKLVEAFEDKGIKIDPKHIIAIMKFAQVEGNDFLEETADYSDWRSYNLDKLGLKVPMSLIIDYIEMYKEKIPEKPKDPQ
ncbi:MAG: hypothetical protein Q8M39_08420 [Sulfuricurvum sp.]|nr:hypothetical protein [Sulfuricurvum sp.]